MVTPNAKDICTLLVKGRYRAWVQQDERVYVARGSTEIGFLERCGSGWSMEQIPDHWRPCVLGCLDRWWESFLSPRQTQVLEVPESSELEPVVEDDTPTSQRIAP